MNKPSFVEWLEAFLSARPRLRRRLHGAGWAVAGLIGGMTLAIGSAAPPPQDFVATAVVGVTAAAPLAGREGGDRRANETWSERAARPSATPVDLQDRPSRRLSDGRRPQIAIVIDDLGLDRAAFDAVNALPGPVNIAFLPYAPQAQEMIDATRPDHAVMLHLPMEPVARKQDAGPDPLLAAASAADIRATLARNLSRLSGYQGVNNHTGSLFTSQPHSMRVVLEELSARDLFFLDSVTTHRPVAAHLATVGDFRVVERDVFLDAGYPNVTPDTVKAQLARLEQRAIEQGRAIAIGHPYAVTLETLGPWLVTAEARGFELVTVETLAPARRTGEILARVDEVLRQGARPTVLHGEGVGRRSDPSSDQAGLGRLR